jgi:hypothetical protein
VLIMGVRALWLGLAVVWSAGEAAAQRLPFTWDVPKVLEQVEVPGVMKADGIPVKLRSVKSAEKPEVLLQHMTERFKAWGFFLPPPQHRKQYLREPHLTALDTERLIAYTFILQPNPDGTTTVMMGEAHLAQGKQPPSPIAPVFPGATDVVNSHLEVARSLTYSVRGKPAKEVEAFYRVELGKAGYAEVEPLVFRKGTDDLQVFVRPAKADQLSVVVLRRVATEGANPPDPR